MRVAYLINQYPKITHTFVRAEIAAVERAGVTIDRIAIRRSPIPLLDVADQEEARRTEVLLDAGVGALLLAVAVVAVVRPRQFWRALCLAIRIGRASERGVLYHLAYLAEACMLLRRFARQPVDHMHATFGSNPAAVALLCRALGGPSYSFTAHGPEEFDRAPLLAIREKAEHAAFVVVVSEAGRRYMQQWCPPESWENIHLVRCGIDRRFANEADTPISTDRRFVFVGRLAPEKAPLLVIEAVAQLIAGGEPCELVMIGDGDLRGSIETRLRMLGHSDRVRLVGWADSDQIRTHIRASRALVLPSFAEGLPVVLMEALALHRPVICTQVGGVTELVEDGVCGWVVPAGSLDSLVAALRAALNASTVDLERMGRNGAARVRQQHDAETEGRKLAALFEAQLRTS